jgi:molybdate transport repressor ModE-like protein
MNLRQLKTLVELAETGSFSAAGRAVGLSHSAVSLHVKALEEELNVQLVDRSRRPPTLTNRGLALV